MLPAQSAPAMDDLLKPETREELRQRLQKKQPGPISHRATFVLEQIGLSHLTESGRSRGASKTQRPVSAELVSPLAKGQLAAGSVQNPTLAVKKATSGPERSSLSQLLANWKNPEFRRDRWSKRPGGPIYLAIMGILIFAFLVWALQDAAEVLPARVRIVSNPPGADVHLDGQQISGTTPLEWDLAPGTYRIAVTKPGFDPMERVILVEPTAETQVFAQFELAKSSVDTEKVWVTIRLMDVPGGADLQIGDQRFLGTSEAKVHLAPGTYPVVVSKPDYETIRQTLVVKAGKAQQLPIRLTPTPRPKSESRAVKVVSHPPGADILLWEKFIGKTTPALLSPDPDTDHLTVRLEGFQVQRVERGRQDNPETFTFFLERVPVSQANATASDATTSDRTQPKAAVLLNRLSREPVYREGISGLTPDQRKALADSFDQLLNQDWNASPEQGVELARLHNAYWKRFVGTDPRLYHAYGLTLWHHGRFEDAKNQFAEAVKLQRDPTGGERVPYFPVHRDLIRLQSVTGEEVLAAEELLALVRETSLGMRRYPQWLSQDALENADFAGRLMGFLQGPRRRHLASEVNLRKLNTEIEEGFSAADSRETYQAARDETLAQYQDELMQADAQTLARNEKEESLQQSGELGTTRIKSVDRRVSGHHVSSDADSQSVTPFRLPSPNGRFGYYGYNGYYFQNLLFVSGPAIHRNVFNNRATDTTRVTTKLVKEQLPDVQRRRPESLNTYLPQELERKRRLILQSLPPVSNKESADE